MKTLRELGIEPSDDLLRRLEKTGDPHHEAGLLTQREAIEEECIWKFGYRGWSHWFEDIITHYGGRIVFGDGDE